MKKVNKSFKEILGNIQEGLSYRFIYNFNKNNSYKKQEDQITLPIYFKYIPKEDYIVSAFDWSDTPEGYDYWADVQYKYKEALKELDEIKQVVLKTKRDNLNVKFGELMGKLSIGKNSLDSHLIAIEKCIAMIDKLNDLEEFYNKIREIVNEKSRNYSG